MLLVDVYPAIFDDMLKQAQSESLSQKNETGSKIGYKYNKSTILVHFSWNFVKMINFHEIVYNKAQSILHLSFSALPLF